MSGETTNGSGVPGFSGGIFRLQSKCPDSRARTGVLSLPHGDVETPAFMPVGTNGTVKAIHHETLEKIGFRLILGNTYHLYLRPGNELIRKYGGLHGFSNWKHNILTDSGGFQVFSLAPFRKIREEGVRFRSHIDGSYHSLTPERVVELQEGTNSDILMPLDVCTPPGIEYAEALKALELTTRWLARSVAARKECPESYQGKLFGIVQGNFYKDLRHRSLQETLELDTPGIAIGGLSVGEPYSQFTDFLADTAQGLPDEKPRYLMGIGTPEYILDAVENGIDIFDCVLPTRIARNGAAFTPGGTISLKKAPYTEDLAPIQEGCPCRACRDYTRAYIRHLFKANEILGPMLVTEHNLTFLHRMIEDVKKSIQARNFLKWKRDFLRRYSGDAAGRSDAAVQGEVADRPDAAGRADAPGQGGGGE